VSAADERTSGSHAGFLPIALPWSRRSLLAQRCDPRMTTGLSGPKLFNPAAGLENRPEEGREWCARMEERRTRNLADQPQRLRRSVMPENEDHLRSHIHSGLFVLASAEVASNWMRVASDRKTLQ